jgi:hypothetical protein
MPPPLAMLIQAIRPAPRCVGDAARWHVRDCGRPATDGETAGFLAMVVYSGSHPLRRAVRCKGEG